MELPKPSNFACDRCRSGKRKCDAAKPECSRCQRQNKLCVYSTEERPKKRKYWDEAYVSSLENQVKTLLHALEAANGPAAAGPSTSHETSLVATPQHEVGELAGRVGQTRDGARPNEIEYASQLRRRNKAPQEPQDRSLAAMEELSVMMWRTNIGDGVTIISEPSTGPRHNIDKSEQPDAETIINPPPNVVKYCQDAGLLHDLAALFIDNINSEHQFTSYSSTEFLGSYPYQNPEIAFLHSSLLAVGATFSKRVDAVEISEAFAQFAESLVFTCFRSRPSIHVVQGLCMLSWRSLALGKDHFGWIFISMAAGLCVHLRLHVLALGECEARSWQPQPEDIQTFWMFYIIDRTAISILGRNCVLPWRRVNVPDFDATFAPDAAGIAKISFTWQCKLWFLHDEQMDQVFATKFEAMQAQQQVHLLVSTHEALRNFFKSRDRRLDLAGSATNSHVLFFHMAYQMALLITLPPFLRCFAASEANDIQSSDLLMLILKSLTTAASAMVRLVRMYRDAHIEKWTNANPVVIHHLLSASIVHMMNATSTSISLKMQSARWLRIAMDLLVQLQMQWPNRASKTIKVIRVLAERWRVLGALPFQFSYRVEASPEDPNSASGQHAQMRHRAKEILRGAALPGEYYDLNHATPSQPENSIFPFAGVEMDSLGAYSNFDLTGPAMSDFGVVAQRRFDEFIADGDLNWLFEGEIGGDVV